MDCLHRGANGAGIAGWPTHTMSFPCGEKSGRLLKGGGEEKSKMIIRGKRRIEKMKIKTTKIKTTKIEKSEMMMIQGKRRGCESN